MATISTTYSDASAAMHVTHSLASVGVPPEQIAVLIGAPPPGRPSDSADVNRVVTCDATGEHTRPASDADARRLLTQARVPELSVEHMLGELHEGGAVVIATVDAVNSEVTEALTAWRTDLL